MQCPQCNIDLIIKHSSVAVEDGKPVTVQNLYCRNPQCSIGRNGTLVRQIRHKNDTEPEDLTGYIICHGVTLAKVADDEYSVPDYINHALTDGEMSVTCPECGKTYGFSTSGKQRI